MIVLLVLVVVLVVAIVLGEVVVVMVLVICVVVLVEVLVVGILAPIAIGEILVGVAPPPGRAAWLPSSPCSSYFCQLALCSCYISTGEVL